MMTRFGYTSTVLSAVVTEGVRRVPGVDPTIGLLRLFALTAYTYKGRGVYRLRVRLNRAMPDRLRLMPTKRSARQL